MFLVTYFDDIYWEKIVNGDKMQKILLKELESIGVTVMGDKFDK